MPLHPSRRQFVGSLVAAPLFVRHARAAEVSRFALGVASGHPRHDRLVLWTRLVGDDLPGQVEVQWELAHDEAFTKIAARGTEIAEAAWAHSVHAEPQGLAPGREYWYRFTALGQRSTTGRTRTAPAPDAAATLRFAIASCQRYDHNHYAAWRHMATQALDLVLFLGDYIYEYASPPTALRAHEGTTVLTLADYRARYAQYKSDPALQAAHAMAPWITLWDDHEVENDYAGDVPQHGGAHRDFARRRAWAVQAWWEHMPVPKAMRPRGSVMRWHERYDWGALARVHTLDGRAYRDEQVCKRFGRARSNTVEPSRCPAMGDPARSLPGHAQERWLAEGWDLRRPWNLLAQQTLMARYSWADPAVEGAYWNDGWDGYPASRERVLQGIAERQLPGAVVLGGDVHAHYVADLKVDYDDARSPVVASEFCGTSIASHGMAQARLESALPYNPHVKFARSDRRGYVSFVLDARQLQAELHAVRDARDPASEVDVAARFVVEHGRPGAQVA